MYRHMMIWILTLGMAFSSALVLAQDTTDNDQQKRPGRRGQMQNATQQKGILADLTEDQKAKLKKAHEANAKVMVQLQADIKVAEMEQRAALSDPEADKSRIQKSAKKLGDAQAKVYEARANQHLAMKDVLNDDQWASYIRRAQFAQRWSKGNQGMRSQRGRRGDTRPGMQQRGRRGGFGQGMSPRSNMRGQGQPGFRSQRGQWQGQRGAGFQSGRMNQMQRPGGPGMQQGSSPQGRRFPGRPEAPPQP
jgi:Spy/CpxP family protein refolding chaperone